MKKNFEKRVQRKREAEIIRQKVPTERSEGGTRPFSSRMKRRTRRQKRRKSHQSSKTAFKAKKMRRKERGKAWSHEPDG